MIPSSKQQEELRDLEVCFRQYFHAQIKPVMEKVRQDLTHRQFLETEAYMNSPAGRLAMNDTNGMGPLMLQMSLQTTGEWNSKTTEDYLQMCRDGIQEHPHISGDLTVLSDTWRRELIDIIGREAYDCKSQALGQDLADAYVGYRMESMMVQYLVDKETPRSAMDYIMRKAAGESLLGLVTGGIHQTPLDAEISEAAERAYGPTIIEKGTSKALGFGADVLTTGGFSSWASVGKLALTEVAFTGGGAIFQFLNEEDKPMTVEEYISHGVFGSESNILGDCQRESRREMPALNSMAQAMNSRLDGRLRMMDEETAHRMFPFPTLSFSYRQDPETDEEEIHLPFQPGYDPQHPERFLAQQQNMTEEEQRTATTPPAPEEDGRHGSPVILDEQVSPTPPQQSTDGWGSMLTATGLDGLGSVGHNLGYVISMLPNVLVGLFTGNTRGLGLKDNMLPLASILVGLFVRNPLLKTVLIGMGGLNLFNKAGKEILEDQQIREQTAARGTLQFRRYADEPLNSRMSGPEIKGNSLFATVDGVPCTVQLPENTVAAYRAGVLPLNTLANAVLAKSDEMSRLAQENYEQHESRESGIGRGI